MVVANLDKQYKKFQKLIDSYLSKDHTNIVKKAYLYAEKAHGDQTRLTGERFIMHPLATAYNLAELHLDYQTISAGLLHDVVEDCDVSNEDLTDEFGEDIAKLVFGVTKLTEVENVSEIRWEENTQTHSLAEAQTLRKMLMTVAEDVRVVLIKLSDRLHNMETVDPLPGERKIKFAKETMEIYAPLAHRLGMWDFKWRLEDLSFRILDPNMYKKVAKLINSKRKNRDTYIEKAANSLAKKLQNEGITADVKGRSKHLFSTYRKILAYEKENKSIDEINDLFAIRVVVQDVKDCYIALGSIHDLWPPLGGQFDDYIARPKDNMYRSIHTTVNGDDNYQIEIQIRTSEMDQYAEYGIAAHWKYKEGSLDDSTFDNKMIWLRQLLDWQREVPGDQEFIDSFKTDIFNDQVYVFTPKGDIKELPTGSTPLDFAYRVHTDIGHSCIGARVNEKLVPLNSVLKNGDKVFIVTSPSESEPSLDWLNPNLGYLVTASAKEKIRLWFRKSEKEENIKRGQFILDKELAKLDLGLKMDELVSLTNYNSYEELVNNPWSWIFFD
ncbi:MAG: RelA/SpoT family protein [Dehalococcoidia bacterium]